VGADAAALELRDLAGYMALYDGGSYVNTVVNGKKEDGTEMHTVNRKALEIDSRDDAKTWFYAFIYGAGDEKLGSIVLKTPEDRRKHWQENPSAHLLYQQRANQGRPITRKQAALIDRGAKDRAKFLKNLPALGKLTERVQQKAKKTGYLLGLDGRRLHVRGQHSALNTLLQSAGAVQMKLALIILDDNLQAQGLRPGIDYEFIANVHDEWQLEVTPSYAADVGHAAVKAIRQAGEEFGFGCPLDGEYKIGKDWSETH
jgi:DNA polymerase I-like protein with 3'-5' exonuclease and polymerase domains